MTPASQSGLIVPGTQSAFLPAGPRDGAGPPDGAPSGRLRYLAGGEGPPVVLLHTVRTQAEHFHRLMPLLMPHRRVFALDLPEMGHSDIVAGARYDEAAMRAAVVRLVGILDLHDVTLIGESMGAVLALTAAAELPDRIARVVAVNPYDYPGGLSRSGLLARAVMTAVATPAIGPVAAGVEPRPALRRILQGGLVDRAALTEDYLDELARTGRRPGYPAVARAVYRNLPSLIAARPRYARVEAPIDLVYGDHDWSRRSDRDANARLLPAASVTEVRDAGHFIALERPDVIARITL